MTTRTIRTNSAPASLSELLDKVEMPDGLRTVVDQALDNIEVKPGKSARRVSLKRQQVVTTLLSLIGKIFDPKEGGVDEEEQFALAQRLTKATLAAFVRIELDVESDDEEAA